MMGTSWIKLLVVVAALFIASGSAHAHAHAKVPHEESRSVPCVAHDHEDAGHHHPQNAGDDGDCCCSCFNCASGMILPATATTPSLIAFAMAFSPVRTTPLKSRMLSPELDPPRPSAPS